MQKSVVYGRGFAEMCNMPSSDNLALIDFCSALFGEDLGVRGRNEGWSRMCVAQVLSSIVVARFVWGKVLSRVTNG